MLPRVIMIAGAYLVVSTAIIALAQEFSEKSFIPESTSADAPRIVVGYDVSFSRRVWLSLLPISLQNSIARLRFLLARHRLLFDEKEWVDRPILNNNLEKDIQKVEYFLDQADQNADCDALRLRVEEMLSSSLGKADADIVKLPQPAAAFIAEKESRFEKALNILKSKASTRNNLSESLYWKDVVAMAEEALQTFSNLYKQQVLPNSAPLNTPHFKVYTDSSFQEEVTNIYNSFFGDGGAVVELNFVVPERKESTMIDVPYPMVVPGGRFREAYYWDSYFVVRAFLSAGKVDKAMQIVNNFFALIDVYGFVPNGFRTYYLDRSQPPLLSHCVKAIYDYLQKSSELKALDFLKQAFPRLLKEYAGFWMHPKRGHLIRLDKHHGFSELNNVPSLRDVLEASSEDVCYLNRYYSGDGRPRPESHHQDEQLADKYAKNAKEIFFKNVRAAAESGWDFSSRWSQHYAKGDNDGSSLYECESTTPISVFETLDTINMIPVDLNSFMQGFERHLIDFAHQLRDKCTECQQISSKIETFHTQRQLCMTRYMHDAASGVYRDFHARSGELSKVISAASLVHLWINPDQKMILSPHLFENWGITPTTSCTGQQWDSPNVWPPLVYFAVYSLKEADLKVQNVTAKSLASRYVQTVFQFYMEAKANQAEGFFSEKYNAQKIGSGGSGGEYPNQVGFGWTNAVLIEIISDFASDLMSPLEF